jgi:hypothetical protein
MHIQVQRNMWKEIQEILAKITHVLSSLEVITLSVLHKSTRWRLYVPLFEGIK